MKLRERLIVIAVLAGQGLFGINSSGQAVASVAAAQTSPVAAQAAVGTMQRQISVNFREMVLPDALKEIQRLGNLQIAYAREDVPQNRKVTLIANSITVSSALAKILNGTGLGITVPATDKIVISPKRGREQGSKGQGVISGRVTDAKSGKGLAGANVSVNTDTRGVVTGEDGIYRITGVISGTHTVSVRLVGYAKQSSSVTVGKEVMVTVDFKLEASANVLDQVVVTGTVVSTELKAVPNAITVITAKQIEERGITRIDQLFRGDIPGLFALNQGSNVLLDEVLMFSRGATALSSASAGTTDDVGSATFTNPIKTYIDGVEMVDSKYLSQIDPRSIERIEVLSGPQASTIYGSNAINGVMQIFTKRGTSAQPQLELNAISGVIQNNLSTSLAPVHSGSGRVSGVEGRWSYNISGSSDYTGSWTPARNTVRYNASSGGRMDMGKLAVDMSARKGLTQNRQGGDKSQSANAWVATGLRRPSGQAGNLEERAVKLLRSQTLGLSVRYTPAVWWSHDFTIGNDATNVESLGSAPRNLFTNDTLVRFAQSNNVRSSERYTTTVQAPITTLAAATLTFGIDHWRTRSWQISARDTDLSGALAGAGVTRNNPRKNTGGFVQGQLAVNDDLFLTYGLRAEWNPNYGIEEQPNLAPRYGVAYTREWGNITAKFRASYGRATRPPADDLKLAVAAISGVNVNPTIIELYGPYDIQFENPDLGPEFQQGGEGGLELYLGNRGSVVITRYNQTVDKLIGAPKIDSVRSLAPGATFSESNALSAQDYGYRYQFQNLNIGSIRNQGWELNGSVNAGPLVTRGTYSWTKSRVIGVTPQYRGLFASNSAFEVGRPFDFLPEHTWALAFTYTRAATTGTLAINGVGKLYRTTYLITNAGNSTWRDTNTRLRMNVPANYRTIGSGYATSDLNLSHRFSTAIEGILQIQNITDFYESDISNQLVTMGRQSRIGLRLRVN